MNGTTQGFLINPVTPTGGALASLRGISFGANPVSFHVDKPWVIPDPTPPPSSALKGAIANVAKTALGEYQKRQEEKKKEDAQSTKDWMDWQKFEETQKHNIALENAAKSRALATLPNASINGAAKGDLILKDLLGGGDQGPRPQKAQANEDTTTADQPSLYDLENPEVPDESDEAGAVMKMSAAPAPEATQAGGLTRDSRYTRDAKPNPGVTVRGTSAKTDAQLRQMNDLPSGEGGADEVGLIPGLDDQAAFNRAVTAQVGGVPPKAEAVIPRPGQSLQGAQMPAPVTAAINQAAQQPLPMAGAPMPGASSIVGKAPAVSGIPSPFAGRQLPVFVSAENAPAALALIQQYNANPANPNLIAKGLSPVNKDKSVQILWQDITEQNKAKKAQEEEKKSKSDLAASEKSARIAFREGNSLLASQEIKNYQDKSGLRLGLAKFIPGYVEGEKHPEQRGATDIDLLDNYIRAMSGGKVSEGQAHLVMEAKSLKEKGQTMWNKLFGGDILSQGQRDQFTRSLLDAHNSTAAQANQPMNVVRSRMMKEGVKDEDYLPQPYVDDLMLKKDAVVKKNELANQAKKLTLNEYQEALKTKDTAQIKRVQDRIKQLNEQAKRLSERLYDESLSGHPVLGWEDFEKKRQGFVAGSMGFQYHGSSAGFDGNSEQPVNVNIQAPQL